MTPLKLDKKQKRKLIEMVSKLFPEYLEYEYEEDLYISSHGIMELWKPAGKNKWKGFDIHWFEFAIRYLCPKILTSKGSFYEDEFNEFSRYCIVGDEHPIDYLYSIFSNKKL